MRSPKALIMGGSSQTGFTTLSFIQQAHAKARLADGKPIYDGYLPMEAPATGAVRGGDAAVIHVLGEGDLMVGGGLLSLFATARDDADASDDRFRHYQFAAASHVVTRGVTDPKTVFPTLADLLQPGEVLNQFPSAPFYEQAARHLVDWVTKGTVPPKGARFEAKNGQLQRDEHGNVKGGIRSPWVDVPTARYIAGAPATPTNPMRGLIGLQEVFSAEKLRSLYGTREVYLQRFDARLEQLVEERWISAEDGGRLKQEERMHAPQF